MIEHLIFICISITIHAIEINPQTGDIFAAFVCNASPSYDGLLFYDSHAKSWNLYTTSNSAIPSDNIRDLKRSLILSEGIAEFEVV